MQNTRDRADLNESYRSLLQRQVAIMETEIKLLKDREVEQKNKVSGFETLLADKIPLNEHFLALKNKYNKEKDEWIKNRDHKNNYLKNEQEGNQEKRFKINQRQKEVVNLTKTLQDKQDDAAKKRAA